MIHPDHLRRIIQRTLKQYSLWSVAIEELLLGTAAQESCCGRYLHQIRGPALGIYQMEPATEQDIWESYLFYRPRYTEIVIEISGVEHPDLWQLEVNLAYQTIMARMHYRRIPVALPAAGDLHGQANYWDKHFNRNPNKGYPADYIKAYQKHIK